MSENPMDVLMLQRKDSVKKINVIKEEILVLERDNKRILNKLKVGSLEKKVRNAMKKKLLSNKKELKEKRETKTLLEQVLSLTVSVIEESNSVKNRDQSEEFAKEPEKTMDEWLQSAMDALEQSVNSVEQEEAGVVIDPNMPFET